MSAHATGTFEVKAWDEKPFDEIDGGGKLARASVTKSFHGDIEGEGKVEYLMMHRADRSAIFVGLERVTGRLGDRSGSFAEAIHAKPRHRIVFVTVDVEEIQKRPDGGK